MKNVFFNIFFVSIGFMLFSCGNQDQKNTESTEKEHFQNKEGRFEVAFEKRPEIQTSEAKTPSATVTVYAFYERPDSNSLFMVSYNDMPKAEMRPTAEESLNEMAAGLRDEFSDSGFYEEKPLKWQNKYPGLSVRVKNKGICMYTLMILDNLRYYQVTVMHQGEGCVDEKKESAFIESFKILE